ncbi:MAG: competence/damage-inducible protein A [Epsilonproteobacteria bacterium]|nr:competence/damage-inducible protein A [Campylobacterota bacterium]
MFTPNFFILIIGTEILNQRRQDKHFDFVSSILNQYGHKLSGSFVIEDDPALIVQTLKFIDSQPNAVLFSFGGIGSTPDDHTRKSAAIALKNGNLYQHKEATTIIEKRFEGEEVPAYAMEIGQLPKHAKLLENAVNKMPGFYLDDRYFFMPGFPSMSHPMVEHILETFFANKKEIYRYTLTALCRESELIEVMKQMPKEVEFSSLPKFYSDGWKTIISVASEDKALAKKSFKLFKEELKRKEIYYGLGE